MEKLINYATEGYAGQYINLTQQALAKIVKIVKAKQGRITLFAMRDTWDDDASEVREEVRDNSVELIIDNGGGSVTMYPIDFLDNNGYVSVLLVDEYGDHPRIYADKMDDITICTLADFLVRLFEQETYSEELNIGDSVLVPEPNGSDIHMHEFSGYVKSFRGDNAIVEDADGNCFEIEIERLTLL
jgi:hypothetical protein